MKWFILSNSLPISRFLLLSLRSTPILSLIYKKAPCNPSNKQGQSVIQWPKKKKWKFKRNKTSQTQSPLFTFRKEQTETNTILPCGKNCHQYFILCGSTSITSFMLTVAFYHWPLTTPFYIFYSFKIFQMAY